LKWKSHIAIAKAIAGSMGFPKDLEKEFSRGLIRLDGLPDRAVRMSGRERRYMVRAAHHKPKLI